MLHRAVPPETPFTSAKTENAIPIAIPLVRHALVQASLDPKVRRIRSVQTGPDGARAASHAIVVTKDDGRFVLDVVDARCGDTDKEQAVRRAFERLGISSLTMSSDEITAEPRFGNARTVWQHRMHPVGIDMRMKILSLLAEDGPMQLGELLPRIDARRDPAPAVMALACSDLIELDLITRPLGPQTVVRSRA